MDKPFDEYSDLDLVIRDLEKLVLFDQGVQVDFLFRHVSELERSIDLEQIPKGFHRGVKLLIDKTGKGHKPTFIKLSDTIVK